MNRNRILALSLLTLLTALPLTAAELPQVQFTIYPTEALSVDSPNITQNRANIMNGLSGQVVPRDQDANAAAWNVISNNFTFARAITSSASSGFNLWRAVNPGAKPQEWGERILWAVRAQSVNGVRFKSSNIRFSVMSSDVALNLNGWLSTNSSNGSEIRYSSTFWGRVGGTWFTGGQTSAMEVDEALYIGVRSSYSAVNMTEVNNAKAIMIAPGWYATCRYFMQDGTGTGSGSATLTTQPWIENGPKPDSTHLKFIVHGQPGVSYKLQSANSLTTPPSAIVWITRPDILTDGGFEIVPIDQFQEYFRLIQVSGSSFAPAGAAVSSGGSSND